MKILVLMPCDEKSVYMGTGILRNVSEEKLDKYFSIPMFMDFLIETKRACSWEEARIFAIYNAEKIYEQAKEKNQDLVIIGNINEKYSFDAIFNFQDIEKDLPYKDKFGEKIAKQLNTDEKLKHFNHLHQSEESIFTLHDCKATANFLDAYLDTDPKIEELKKEYRKRCEIKC